MRWTWIAGSTWGCLDVKYNSYEPSRFNAPFFWKVWKERYFKILGRAVLDGRPKSPFSGIKILEDCTWLFNFSQQPKVSLIVILTKENIEKRRSFRHAKEISYPSWTSGTMPLCKRWVALKYTTHAGEMEPTFCVAMRSNSAKSSIAQSRDGPLAIPKKSKFE